MCVCVCERPVLSKSTHITYILWFASTKMYLVSKSTVIVTLGTKLVVAGMRLETVQCSRVVARE